jgi:hypothetical protein
MVQPRLNEDFKFNLWGIFEEHFLIKGAFSKKSILFSANY